jgi:DNA-binding CsgD family transcriptional regulator
MERFGDPWTTGVALTARQVQILVLIANGRSTKEIADALGISTKTVACHRGNIMHLLGIREVAGLVRYAVRSGLVEP